MITKVFIGGNSSQSCITKCSFNARYLAAMMPI